PGISRSSGAGVVAMNESCSAGGVPTSGTDELAKVLSSEIDASGAPAGGEVLYSSTRLVPSGVPPATAAAICGDALSTRLIAENAPAETLTDFTFIAPANPGGESSPVIPG